ncbi:MAG: Crp/Fnr family transcriptional regulator [Bacteroidetes bacterium]|nr:Crp/Fnr family transcriptional regulator [Bacteroidota bacterium]
MVELISSVDELIAYLKSICALPFSDGLEKRLRKVVRCKAVARNEFLLKVGEVSGHIYFIQKGVLRCYYETKKGDVTSWVLKEGDIVVSVQSFYHQKPSIENIQAVEEAVVFYISYDELEELYREFPEFNFIGRVLTIKYLIFWNMQLYNLRMREAKERFQLLIEGEDSALFNRVSQQILASYLGMTEHTFSRMKKS